MVEVNTPLNIDQEPAEPCHDSKEKILPSSGEPQTKHLLRASTESGCSYNSIGQHTWVAYRKRPNNVAYPKIFQVNERAQSQRIRRTSSSILPSSPSGSPLPRQSSYIGQPEQQDKANTFSTQSAPHKEESILHNSLTSLPRKTSVVAHHVMHKKKKKMAEELSTSSCNISAEEEELLVHEQYHAIQKEKDRAEALKKLQEADGDLIDDGTDYGKEVFNVPNFPRFILMSPNPTHYYQIRAGTLTKLVERLTSLVPAFFEEYSTYCKIFFTTYRSFATPEEVLNIIIRRFKGFGDSNSDTDDTNWPVPFAKIQQGCCFALTQWYKDHYRDFCLNGLTSEIEKFVEYAKPREERVHRDLITSLAKTVQEKNETGSYPSIYSVVIDQGICPEPVLPKTMVGVTFLDLDELEIARQLTMEEYNIYAEIKPEELQELAWSKEHLKYKSPNLLQMIERFNHISNAFATLLVKQSKLKQRKKFLEKCVRIMEELEHMNSFNMQMAIMSAFGQSAIHRLKYTWGAVKPKFITSAKKYQDLFTGEGSYKNFREAIKEVSPPAIPFLGVYLTDLTFVDEGNPKYIDGLINFKKKILEYDVIVQVLRFQGSSYHYKIVPQICNMIKKLPTLSEDDMYALSLEIEPRESRRKDIK